MRRLGARWEKPRERRASSLATHYPLFVTPRVQRTKPADQTVRADAALKAARFNPKRQLSLVFLLGLEDLLAPVLAGLQINVVRTAQLA